MSEFEEAQDVESFCDQLRLAAWPRSRNRAKINRLANGLPPYTEEEELQDNIAVNVNDLSLTHIAMSARGQWSNALITPDPLVNVELDYGPVWRKRDWADTISTAFNRELKNSKDFLEEEKSVGASTILHGIGPTVWHNREALIPTPKGIEDILVPGNTLRSCKNLTKFAVYEQYTGEQLIRLTTGPNVDAGWNIPMVKDCIKWIQQESQNLLGANWPDTMAPEKWEETIKESAGLYATDRVPTVDVYHLYYWSDEGKQSGWRKRTILDMWGSPGPGGFGGVVPIKSQAPEKDKDRYKVSDESRKEKDGFLFTGGKRKYADTLDELIHFQFGDASPVAPFRYHSVRSLGFLLYAVCHVQNRLKCKFTEAAFENLMQYFRVADPDDAERVTKIDLINRGVIADGVNFMPQSERWQPNEKTFEIALQLGQNTIQQNASNFIQDFDFEREKQEETATRTMAKVNSTAALIGAMLNDAYNYQKYKFMEMARRLCIPNSSDPAVKRFRTTCLSEGVPLEALNHYRWNINPVRVIGQGNKTLQIAMADKLMATVYDKLGPDEQLHLKRLFISVNTGDDAMAKALTPDIQSVSNSKHDAEVTAGTLMLGMPVTPQSGGNPTDKIEGLLTGMASVIKRINATGGMATQAELIGLGNLAQHIEALIQMMAKDKSPAAKQKTNMYKQALGKLMNMVKAYGQRLQEQQKAQQAQNGGMDAADKAKLAVTVATGAAKIKIQKDKAAQTQAQKTLAFQQKLQHQEEEHRFALAKDARNHMMEVANNRLKSVSEE
jgi:hypothetical protein